MGLKIAGGIGLLALLSGAAAFLVGEEKRREDRMWVTCKPYTTKKA